MMGMGTMSSDLWFILRTGGARTLALADSLKVAGFDAWTPIGSSSKRKSRNANITIALLQEFDQHDGLLFAATNVAKGIDAAIWRRFELQIEIDLPGPEEIFAIVSMYLKPFVAEEETVIALAGVLTDASPALIREVCEGIKRAMVLGPRMNLSTDLPDIALRIAASSAPAEGMPVPLLWEQPRTALALLADAAWPPERAS